MNMAEPWSDGQVKSGNHGQFHIQKSNDHRVNHGQIPDVQTLTLIRLWGTNMTEPDGRPLSSQCVDHG